MPERQARQTPPVFRFFINVDCPWVFLLRLLFLALTVKCNSRLLISKKEKKKKWVETWGIEDIDEPYLPIKFRVHLNILGWISSVLSFNVFDFVFFLILYLTFEPNHFEKYHFQYRRLMRKKKESKHEWKIHKNCGENQQQQFDS